MSNLAHELSRQRLLVGAWQQSASIVIEQGQAIVVLAEGLMANIAYQ